MGVSYKEHILSGKPLYELQLVKDRNVNFTYDDQVQVKNPEGVANFLIDFFSGSPREKFVVVFLNTANKVVGIHVASEGGIAASIVEPRAVFGPAMLANAASVVVAHNHPSGNLEPSREDISITRKLDESGQILGIPLMDHLIITEEGFTSLAERGVF